MNIIQKYRTMTMVQKLTDTVSVSFFGGGDSVHRLKFLKQFKTRRA